MAITRPKQPTTPSSVDAFIGAAPDAERGVMKGNKRQITLTISPEMLRDVDAFARKKNLSRATVITLAVTQLLESGLTLETSK